MFSTPFTDDGAIRSLGQPELCEFKAVLGYLRFVSLLKREWVRVRVRVSEHSKQNYS